MYERIKEMAKEIGVRVTDLLAMSPKNDPFYAGTDRDWEMAFWFFEKVWKPAGFKRGVHLRRAHYWAVSSEVLLPRRLKQIKDEKTRKHIYNTYTYMNSIEAWWYLCQAAKMARYLGLVDISSIEDHKNPDPVVYGWFTHMLEPSYNIPLPNLDKLAMEIKSQTYQDLMPVLMEVWCEKSGVRDVLEPLCKRFGMNLCLFQGEASITAVHDLVNRIDGADRPVRIFYISDFDPAGNSMSKSVARKLEWMLNKADMDYLDVRLKSLVLTPEQVIQYKLPRTPIKSTETRGDVFEERFGEGAVELDALEAIHPGVLAKIVEEAAMEYFDAEAWVKVKEMRKGIEDKVRAAIGEVMSRYTNEVEAIRPMFRELELLDVDISEFYEDEPLPFYGDSDDHTWMFDNQRDYTDQITYYKSHAGEDSVFY